MVHSDRRLTRLFRLPAQYLAHRYACDLATRVRSVDKVAAKVSNDLVGVLVELVMSVLFLGLIIYFDPLLVLFVIALAIANVALMRVVSIIHSDRNRQLGREQALLYGTGIFGLRNIDNLTAKRDATRARRIVETARLAQENQRPKQFR